MRPSSIHNQTSRPLPGQSVLPVSLILTAGILLLLTLSAAARTPWPDSPLAPEVQVQLEKAGRYMKSGKPQQAAPIIESAVSSANDIPKCLAIATFSETYGYPLMEPRRRCMQKALSLCQTREDYILVALKSRQFEFYEITRECINHLVQGAKTVDELFDLARKSQEVALNDVAHMAMEKAYSGVKNVPDAIKFAHEVKQMGMDDLVRKVVKDLIDDDENGLSLCNLLKSVESLAMEDLNRYCLKKALDKAETIDELKCIYEAARRNRQNDIMQVALYRGKKLTLIKKIRQDRDEYAKQMKDWQEGVQQDLAKQQAEAEKNMGNDQGGKRFGAEGNAPENPNSGF